MRIFCIKEIRGQISDDLNPVVVRTVSKLGVVVYDYGFKDDIQTFRKSPQKLQFEHYFPPNCPLKL